MLCLTFCYLEEWKIKTKILPLKNKKKNNSGVFGGNLHLKSLLQWCAASLSERSIDYFTFGDRSSTNLELVVRTLGNSACNMTVNTLWTEIVDFTRNDPGGDLFGYLVGKYAPEDVGQLKEVTEPSQDSSAPDSSSAGAASSEDEKEEDSVSSNYQSDPDDEDDGKAENKL